MFLVCQKTSSMSTFDTIGGKNTKYTVAIKSKYQTKFS